ncbi:hypothetical protein [Bacteroides difficilis]|jgi:hypothetical protein|uniref:Uncharacterized protein n=1 Tax=Bacteroides difficilis TaxID=2763021 RepID=A0ABR7CEI1_9BACE|nr:hypothetical protein [Bacteroides difficilis]MBC5606153.1 hypothetical protein [Bacteroides difficilis]UWF79847.1 MAG: hypothetical protein [Bacteriophage sp.]
MKNKDLKYIAHAIIVVAFMGLIAFVIYFTGKTAFLWLLLFVFLYQPWGEVKAKQTENNE